MNGLHTTIKTTFLLLSAIFCITFTLLFAVALISSVFFVKAEVHLLIVAGVSLVLCLVFGLFFDKVKKVIK